MAMFGFTSKGLGQIGSATKHVAPILSAVEATRATEEMLPGIQAKQDAQDKKIDQMQRTLNQIAQAVAPQTQASHVEPDKQWVNAEIARKTTNGFILGG